MNTNASTSVHTYTAVWLLLLLLTLVTLAVGEMQLGGLSVAVFVLAMTLVKGQLVASWFMGLRRAPLLWQVVMTGYLVVVVAAIAIAYVLGLD